MKRDGGHAGSSARATQGRGARAALTGVLLGALLLAGCSTGDGDEEPTDAAASTEPSSTPEAATTAPTLKPKWSIPGMKANPASTGEHHWLTEQVTTSGIGRGGTTAERGNLLLVDVRSGRARHRSPEEDRWPCLLPDRLSDSGVTPVLWFTSIRDPESGVWERSLCDTLTVQDATTGKMLWRSQGLGPGEARALGATDTVVAVVDAKGKLACFGARDGKPVTKSDADCQGLGDRLTHADLPDLVDPDGTSAPITVPSEELNSFSIREIGRNDEILLVRAANHVMNGIGVEKERWTIRAHDLETGETLWQDDDLAPDPHTQETWSRDETYFVAPSGVVRVSYEHTEKAEDAVDTPMVLTAVDPLTGKDIKPIARIEGAWFNHQFDNVLVALTKQERQFRSTISGFELPTW